jgi:hypothetical protein
MAHRRLLGWVPVAALAVCALAACKDKSDIGEKKASVDLVRRCEQLGKACGDSDKHVQKIVEECKQAAATQVDKGCTREAVAAYDCYEKELCGKGDKVWTLDDFRVLSDRFGKCLAERGASRRCVGN